ncbi:MAG: tetratricopeptide repeat protein [Elusimicrobiota bacterium]
MKKQIKTISSDELDLIEKGKFYFLNGKYDEAIDEFEKVLKINPQNADAYFNLGITKEAKNDFSGAKKMFEKVIEIQPSHKSAKKHLDKLVGL